MARASNKKVIWAIDPFLEDRALQLKTARTAKALVSDETTVIEPVYVLSPDHLNWTGDFTGPWTERFRPLAEKSALELVADAKVPQISPPTILIEESRSKRDAINKLLEYAAAADVEFIAISTHGRSGMERLFVGSFTESLLLQTRIPVLIVNHSNHVDDHYKNMVFATDFSPDCLTSFQQILPVARERKMQVQLYYKIPSPIDPVIQSGVYMLGGGWVSVEAYFAKEQNERQVEADRWIKTGQENGVDVQVTVEDYGTRTSDSIIAFAEKAKHCLIVMTPQTGRMTSALLGSVTREVIRGAHYPVWVVPPQSKSDVST